MGGETTRRLLIVGVINHLIRIHRRVHVCQLYIRVALQKHILAYIRKHAHNIIDMHTVTSMHTHGLFTQSCSRFSLVFRGAHSLQKSSCLAGKQTSCLHVVHPPSYSMMPLEYNDWLTVHGLVSLAYTSNTTTNTPPTVSQFMSKRSASSASPPILSPRLLRY